MKRLVCVCGMALVLGIGGAEVFRSQSRAAQSGPAPGGGVRPRAEAYWQLLASGDREGASRFLRPEDRPYFLGRPGLPLQDPEVEEIELSADGTRAVARIGYELFTPAGLFPWALRQAWTCVGGAWVAEPSRSAGNPFQPTPVVDEAPPPPADPGCRP